MHTQKKEMIVLNINTLEPSKYMFDISQIFLNLNQMHKTITKKYKNSWLKYIYASLCCLYMFDSNIPPFVSTISIIWAYYTYI